MNSELVSAFETIQLRASPLSSKSRLVYNGMWAKDNYQLQLKENFVTSTSRNDITRTAAGRAPRTTRESAGSVKGIRSHPDRLVANCRMHCLLHLRVYDATGELAKSTVVVVVVVHLAKQQSSLRKRAPKLVETKEPGRATATRDGEKEE